MRNFILERRGFLKSALWTAGSCLVLEDLLLPQQSKETSDFGQYRTGERIAATPTFRYRPYRSKSAKDAYQTSWVQIDLGADYMFDVVNIFPANQRLMLAEDAYYPGEGFPVRFKIEAADEPEFTHAKLIADLTAADFDNPKDNILSFPASKAHARYVRLTVTKFAEPLCKMAPFSPPEGWTPCSDSGKYSFALSKIAVLLNGIDIAVSQRVSVDNVYGNPEDAAQVTRPERVETEFVRRDRQQNVIPKELWNPVAYKALAPKSGVRLEGGLFESVMNNNIRYLLDSYTLDDLLLQFRERAGKTIPASTRKPDKFWEEDLAGSNAGRFLMGAGNTLRWIDDAELRSRVADLIDGIAECKETNGYIMAYPEDTMFFSERGAYTRAWLTHGLIEAGYSGNTRAFGLLRGYYDWFNQCKYLPELLRGAVQGGQGMIANTRMYFTPVGRTDDIQVIQRYFLEDRWLEELAACREDQIWQYPYDRPHCYLLTNLEAYLDLYLATGDRHCYDGVRAAWDMYNRHWEQPGGSISIIEYQFDPPGSNSLTQPLGELCGSSFWTFLNQRFQLLSPENERFATEIEKSIYNVAIANQDGSQGLRYHTVLVGHKEAATRENTCCEGQGTRLIGSLPEHIYSIANDGIYVNLFEPSSIDWEHDKHPTHLRMETKFPYAFEVKLTYYGSAKSFKKMHIRVPSWIAVQEMKITVNNRENFFGAAGSFLTLERNWTDGDFVSFTLPITFRLSEYSGTDQLPTEKRYSLMYGPFLYAAVGNKDVILEVPAGARAADFARQLRLSQQSALEFVAEGNPGVVFTPYWRVGSEEFTCFPVIRETSSLTG